MIAVLSLIAFGVASLGVLPSASMLTKWGLLPSGEGTAFPCEEHACGCYSAESCWNGCCCFTIEERLVWARARGAFVPSWARGIALTDREPAARTACCGGAGGEEIRTPVSGRAMSGLLCRGVQQWLFTGVPVSSFEDMAIVSLSEIGACVHLAEGSAPDQVSLDPPVPPPRTAGA